MRSDLFSRLPLPTALLLLSSILELTQAHALPRQTSTVPHRVLTVVSWPLVPTPPPISLEELRRRDLAGDAICGYIGNDPTLPATCQPGSHCVLDAEHGAVGCCPNGVDSCTAGVFTGCVDYNSGAQTEANPYVFTCAGSDVCYKNVFAGGFSQYGCGTASDLATTVGITATGLSTSAIVTVPTQSVSFTESPSSLATPTSIDPNTGTRPFTLSSASGSSTQSNSQTTGTSSSGRSTRSTTSGTASSTGSTTSRVTSTSGSSSSTRSSTTTRSSSQSTVSSSSSSISSSSSSASTSSSSSSSSSSASSSSSSTSSSSSSSTSTTSITSTSSTSSSSTSSTPSSTTSTLPTGATTAAGNAGLQQGGPPSNDKTGAIVGGSISGAAVLIAVVAVAFFLWRRKKRANMRTGPGNGGTAYISPMSGGGGGGFQPLHHNAEGYETGLPPMQQGTTTQITGGMPPGHSQPLHTYHYPGQNPASYAAVGAGAVGAAGAAATYGHYRGVDPTRHADPDRMPLTGEFDDFSRGFNDALEGIQEEPEPQPGDPGYSSSSSGSHVNGSMSAPSGNGYSSNGYSGNGYSHEITGGQAAAEDSGIPARPLWQQNRRPSRNLMWM